MPHSLRCRLKGLCHKKILTDREVARLCKALDTADAIEDIKAEIKEYKDDKVIHAERNEMIDIVLEIIGKHIGKDN